MINASSELINVARTSKHVKVFTLSGIREYPVLRSIKCEKSYIILSLHHYEGVPCYPLIVECGENVFKYTILKNLDKIIITPRYFVESIGEEAIIVKRVDGVLFKIIDPTLSYILTHINEKHISFYELLEDLIAVESMKTNTEYTEDLVETLTIMLGIALGFLAYEAELIELTLSSPENKTSI